MEINDEITIESSKLLNEYEESTSNDDIYCAYQSKNLIESKKHPGDIVEASSLSAVSLPEPSYPISEWLKSNCPCFEQLSDLQIDGILYACQRHQLFLPNNTRAGFFLGDGAGVGKGRQIAGVIIDNYVRGRKKHVWFSVSSDLVVDARRDISDLGCTIKVINGCQELDSKTKALGLSSDYKEGVLFSTYAILSCPSRIRQIIDWCGGSEFEGCLGNEDASTKVASAVLHLQRTLSKARILYCSATGASDIKNIAFMERLGLWGDGTPFKSFNNILSNFNKGGLAMAEMLAMYMKAVGTYVCRSLSFKNAQFETKKIELTPKQEKTYNAAVKREIFVSLSTAVRRTKCSSKTINASFWSAHQRFFKQMCMAIKLPIVLEETKKALVSDSCVVIGLQSTGEAGLQASLKKNEKINDFISVCRHIVLQFITNHFPTTIENANMSSVKVEDEWCTQAKEKLCDYASKIELPNGCLDELINTLGGKDIVAEMTGRRYGLYKIKEKVHCISRYSDNDSLETTNVSERDKFMRGEKLIAVISDAASTGISLHADNRVLNKRRRIHVTWELPWSAEKAVQQLGRSLRSNQTSAPIYLLPVTNLSGEMRFASTVCKRLQHLGALTRGDRRAASEGAFAEFNFDNEFGKQALQTMYTAICRNSLPQGLAVQDLCKSYSDMTAMNKSLKECLFFVDLISEETAINVKENQNRDVSKFFNRILGLPVKKQKEIFEYFTSCMEYGIKKAKEEGRYAAGFLDITASSIAISDGPRRIFDHLLNIKIEHISLEIDRGMSWDSALNRLKLTSNTGDEGFFISKRDIYGRKRIVLATLKNSGDNIVIISRPSTGASKSEERLNDFQKRYKRLNKLSEAKEYWEEEHNRSASECIHGASCRLISCTIGKRKYQIDLLCGEILPILNQLENLVAQASSILSRAERTVRAVKVQLESGERIIGVRFPAHLLRTASEKLTYNGAGLQEETVMTVKDALLKKAFMKPPSIKDYFKSNSKKRRSTDTQPSVDKKQKKLSKCPVCNVSFDDSVKWTTQSMNDHMDNCVL
ncbi:DgyrCDS2335 [Dimorphilus gyrociliatus]|uniref:DgyrCDS2335 n=1 Tax=Dimorphilus gyrociliatus TaxID=2664684 RepID=A0A7I8VBX9_9ANNE|nr:DgyrCDS2335 [Dimorphilus gyrociliatus]